MMSAKVALGREQVPGTRHEGGVTGAITAGEAQSSGKGGGTAAVLPAYNDARGGKDYTAITVDPKLTESDVRYVLQLLGFDDGVPGDPSAKRQYVHFEMKTVDHYAVVVWAYFDAKQIELINGIRNYHYGIRGWGGWEAQYDGADHTPVPIYGYVEDLQKGTLMQVTNALKLALRAKIIIKQAERLQRGQGKA